MFELLFKYPSAVFSKGHLVLLGAWPKWVLALLLVATAVGLALLIRSRWPRPRPASGTGGWLSSGAAICAAVAIVLLLLWQPAIMITQLNPQQNIIAVVVDDSRSMAISDNGSTRLAQAVKALQSGVLDRPAEEVSDTPLPPGRQPDARDHPRRARTLPLPVTHIGDGIKSSRTKPPGLPIGAIVLLSDGADNSGGIDRDTVAALRSRRIPVHTVGFGEEQVPRDVEINDVGIASRAFANSRLAARVSFHQRGFAGGKTTLRVRDGDKVLAARQVTLAGRRRRRRRRLLLFNVGAAGAKSLQFTLDPMPGETNTANNSVARLVNVESAQRRVLYVEGEPRWEYKFIRRAEDDDHSVELVSMLADHGEQDLPAGD